MFLVVIAHLDRVYGECCQLSFCLLRLFCLKPSTITSSSVWDLHHLSLMIIVAVEFLCMVFFFSGLTRLAKSADRIDLSRSLLIWATRIVILLMSSILAPALRLDVNAAKPPSPLVHFHGSITSLVWWNADLWRALWLFTLILVCRQVYIEHSGAVSRTPAPGDAGKNESYQLDDQNNAGSQPMNHPDL